MELYYQVYHARLYVAVFRLRLVGIRRQECLPHLRGPGAGDATFDEAAGNDRARAYDAVHGSPGAVALAPAAEDELGRRQVWLHGADRPDFVIQIEQRIDADEVHVGVVVGVKRADVAPI